MSTERDGWVMAGLSGNSGNRRWSVGFLCRHGMRAENVQELRDVLVPGESFTATDGAVRHLCGQLGAVHELGNKGGKVVRIEGIEIQSGITADFAIDGHIGGNYR